MKQFARIFNFEIKYYFKNKIFIGVTVFLVLLIAAVMFFPRISEMFKNGDTQSEQAERPVMLVKAQDSDSSDFSEQEFAAAFGGYEVKATNEDTETIKDKIASGQAECAFVITGETTYTYYADNISMYDTNTAVADEVLQNIYRINAMVQGGMTPEQAQSVMSVGIEGSVVNLGTDQMKNFFYTYIMIFALYMVILLYGQMVATNVATEKSSRAMEVLITSAKPVSMMFGKVLASCLAGLVQLTAVFGSALLFFSLNRSYWEGNQIIASIFDMPATLFVYMLIFFILGFLIYAFMFGAVGSTASKLEDINTSVMPITMLFVVAFIVVMYSLSSGSVDTTLMKICSYIPFTSPMAMFTRIAMGTVAWYEILISVAVLGAGAAVIGVISAKIYRVGVLLYGTTPKISSILKAVWKA